MTEQQKFGNTDPMLIAKYDDELRKVQGGWRDMDSAPRDGTDVLVYSIEGIELAWWSDGQSAWMTRDGTYVPEEPTHWMPLPPAPTEHPTEQPSEDALEGVIDTIEEIIGETHDIDVTDRIYAKNIVAWLKRHHPTALRSLAQEGE